MQPNFLQEKNRIKNHSLINNEMRMENSISSYSANHDFQSQNELNMGFIAEQSRMLFSDSQSVSEDRSISAISRINSIGHSPNLSRLQEEFSGMEQLQVQSQNNVGFFKRPSPSIVEEENQDDIAINNRCTKRKMTEKMRVMTIKTNVKKQTNGEKQLTYRLRSRGKVSSDSSREDIQQIIDQIDKNKTSKKNIPVLSHSKDKNTQK